MLDMFPFPSATGSTPEEQIASLVNYLTQFKETLEFALGNINVENLSPDLVKKINGLGVDANQSKEEREEELAQISIGNSFSIYDVIDSELFKSALKSEVSGINFNVNMVTGQLEYAFKSEEVNDG